MAVNCQIVRNSFRALGVSEEEVVARFYQLLFEAYPEMKPLLPSFAAGNLERATAEAFRLTLLNLHDPAELSRKLAPYARNMRQNGVRNVHFAALGETWLRTLAALRRDLWTGEISREWSMAYQLAAQALRRPARDLAFQYAG